MAIDLIQLNQQLDNMLADDSEVITPEQLQTLRKVQMVADMLLPKLERAKRGGLNVDSSINRIDEINKKIDTLMREYN